MILFIPQAKKSTEKLNWGNFGEITPTAGVSLLAATVTQPIDTIKSIQ